MYAPACASAARGGMGWHGGWAGRDPRVCTGLRQRGAGGAWAGTEGGSWGDPRVCTGLRQRGAGGMGWHGGWFMGGPACMHRLAPARRGFRVYYKNPEGSFLMSNHTPFMTLHTANAVVVVISTDRMLPEPDDEPEQPASKKTASKTKSSRTGGSHELLPTGDEDDDDEV